MTAILKTLRLDISTQRTISLTTRTKLESSTIWYAVHDFRVKWLLKMRFKATTPACLRMVKQGLGKVTVWWAITETKGLFLERAIKFSAE